MISAILSSYNEANNPIFWDNVAVLKNQTELIVVDGGSQDGTLEQLSQLSVAYDILPGSPRGERYNHGLKRSHGEMVLLVHPRTRIPPEALMALAQCSQKPIWGAFTHQFDDDHPLLRFTSWYSNTVRGGWRGIFYLDHGLFLSRDLLPQAEFPSVEIFEDTYFCLSLRRHQWPVRLPVRTTTSAIRFRRNGVFRQAALNQIMKILFLLGVSDRWMNWVYERGLSLNQKA